MVLLLWVGANGCFCGSECLLDFEYIGEGGASINGYEIWGAYGVNALVARVVYVFYASGCFVMNVCADGLFSCVRIVPSLGVDLSRPFAWGSVSYFV